MAKEYIFKFPGSKESFLKLLEAHPNGDKKVYYIDEYMIELRDDAIRIGVERAGHSGGNWFVSELVEVDHQIEFRGTIQYIGPGDNRTKRQKAFDTFGIILLCVLLFPIIVITAVCRSIAWCIRKICKLPQPKNTEEKLLDVMENRLGCQRVHAEKDL